MLSLGCFLTFIKRRHDRDYCRLLIDDTRVGQFLIFDLYYSQKSFSVISPIFVSVNLQIFAQNVFQTSVCICACVLPKYFSYICVCVSYYKCYFNIANSLLLKLFSTRGFNRRSRNFYNGVKIYILTKSLVSFHLNSKHL